MVMVNGENEPTAAGQNILSFLQQREAPINNVVVELNGEIVRRPEFESTYLGDNDKLELISFVGGGR